MWKCRGGNHLVVYIYLSHAYISIEIHICSYRLQKLHKEPFALVVTHIIASPFHFEHTTREFPIENSERLQWERENGLVSEVIVCQNKAVASVIFLTTTFVWILFPIIFLSFLIDDMRYIWQIYIIFIYIYIHIYADRNSGQYIPSRSHHRSVSA